MVPFRVRVRGLIPCLTVAALLVAAPAPGQEPAPDKPVSARRFPKTDRFGDPLPAGALFRLGTERFRHLYGGPLVYSPDGKLLASISVRYTTTGPDGLHAVLWDAANGKKLHVISNVVGLAFAPDSQSVAVCGRDNIVRVLDAKSNKEKFRLPQDAGRPKGLVGDRPEPFAFAATGELLTWSRRGRAHIWSSTDGKEREAFECDASEVHSLGYCAETKEVVTVDKAFVFRAYDRASGKKSREVALGKPAKWAAMNFFEPPPFFTLDGRFYCDAGHESLKLKAPVHLGQKNTFRVWDVVRGKEIARLPGIMHPLPDSKELTGGQLNGLVLSADGKTLVYVDHFEKVVIVDVPSGKERTCKGTVGTWPMGLALSPDGKTVVAATAVGHSILFWDVATGEEKSDPATHAGNVGVLAVSRDGRLLASGADDRTIKLWDASRGECLHTFRGPDGGIKGLSFAPDGKTLASASNDGLVCFWDLGEKSEKRALRQSGGPPAGAVSYAADGKALAAFLAKPLEAKHLLGRLELADCILHVWDIAKGTELSKQPLEVPASMAKTAASPNGRWLALARVPSGLGVGRFDVLRLFETGRGKEWTLLDCKNPRASRVKELAFSHDGRLLAVVGADRLDLFGTETRNVVRSLGRPAQDLFRVAFSPSGRYLIGAYPHEDPRKTTIRVWELVSETAVLEFVGPQLSDANLLVSPDNKTLYSAGGLTTAYAWGLEPAAWRDKPPSRLKRETMPEAWAALAATDGPKAYEAIWHLADAGNDAVAFLKEKLPPAAPFPQETLDKLLAGLDSKQFNERAAASAELRKLGPRVEAGLRKALAKSPPLEVAKRIQTVLAELEEPLRSTEALQQSRGVEVLQRIATPEARKLLQDLAGDLAEARLTREAQEALRRLR